MIVVSLTMPPVRDRKEDIAQQATYSINKYAKRCKVKAKPLSEEARACLLNYDWPGNVRELENAIERALVLGAADLILPEDLPEAVLERAAPAGMTAKYHSALKETKKQLILAAIEEAKGNYTEAARALGLHPNYLHRLIRNLDLRHELKASGRR